MIKRNQAVADRLHVLGFDVFPLNQKKVPTIKSWKELPDFKELNFTKKNLIGIACGPRSNGLEVIDVDTKVLKSDLGIRSSFEDTFPAVLKTFFEEEYDIDITELVALYRTVSGGYHIVYKTEFVQPNQKLGLPFKEMAKHKKNKEALFETRGEGGYVVCYHDNKIKGFLNYAQIKHIGVFLKDALFQFVDSLSIKEHKRETPKPPPKINRPKVDGVDLISVIRDTYSIEEIISDRFKIYPPDHKGNIKVLRNGSTASSSGSIFNTPHGEVLYLHTENAGNNYPANKSLDVIALIALDNDLTYGEVLRGFIEELKSA